MSLLLKNCHVISPDCDIRGAAVLVENGVITKVSSGSLPTDGIGREIDAQGQMVVPGFVDIHCHGRSGYDFTDAKQEAIEAIAIDKLKEGVTTLLPTTLTLPEENLAATLETAANYVKSGKKGCKTPGVHLEGPFINPKCAGAQNPDFARLPDIEEVKRLNAIFPVKKVSFAVEMDGGAKFAAALLDIGITPSCVHSAATYAAFAAGGKCGLKNLSHFCNQMTGLHHRDIGLVGAGLLEDDLFIELICDKLHICPDMIKLIFKVKNNSYIQIITDAMCASGMPDGEYPLGGLEVVVADGVARLKSNGALAGSTAQFCDGLKNVYEITGIALKELIKTTSWNQAQSLGLENIGKIEPGYTADIVILNDQFQPQTVIVDGEIRL